MKLHGKLTRSHVCKDTDTLDLLRKPLMLCQTKAFFRVFKELEAATLNIVASSEN